MLKEHIKGTAHFVHYRDNCLWYICETDFIFPVPISDIGDATFHHEEKAMLMMRYIRKYMKEIEDNV